MSFSPKQDFLLTKMTTDYECEKLLESSASEFLINNLHC